ncbi:hypothetical protein [Sphingobacterium corticibacter]|uniref:Uncharacterized protein n=1 Tax=Sphingobacterium corticibacter TaxID=2171749 RepID=A0A2T8HID3_9SPHI|nr:hypothetical protein [Sphingobacterium corticibacter]PVH25194.1 hypothetical protein DC487_09725 [Sphingobacterium corticibacter]
MESVLVTLRSFSPSYQNIFDENRIPRMNLVNEIEDMFEKDCKVVVIEGKEAGGKTDLMLQFAQKHLFDSISFFINPSYRASYRQDYLMEDIGRQLYFFNKNEAAPAEFDINESVFNKLTFDLTTSPGRKNKPVYFILDALDQIDKSDFELLKNILQNLPWNTNNFYFLISGNLEELRKILPIPWLKNSKSLRVPRFTESETKKLFELDDSTESQIFLREVHDTWKGHPESLTQVKRIIDSGISKDDFLKDFSISEKNDLLDIEWKRANIDGLNLESLKVFLIAVLAFDDNVRGTNRIASILNVTPVDVENAIGEISFLTKNEDNVTFVSNSYRQFAIHKLGQFENETNSRLINFYTTVDDLNSILHLPNLFQKNNEWGNIVQLLTVDNLDLIISNSKSFSDIKKQINYGYKAAKNIKNAYGEIFRFSLHRSVLTGLQSSDIRKNKIRSYIVLDRPEDALSIITNSVLKEDRLKMLVFFVQYSKIEKKEVDSAIIGEIKDLLSDVDASYLRENLMEVAIGLAYFLPNEAINVIEKALNLKSDNNSIEWLMGIIGMIAHKNQDIQNEDSLSMKDDSAKKESFVDKFAKSIGYGISDVMPEEIIDEIKKVEKASDRIFLMRKWIKGNPTCYNIKEIMDFTLNLLAQESSSIKPSTETLFDIVFPLKFFVKEDLVKSMIRRVDELMLNINSPTVGKVMLHIVIVEALMNVDVELANNRTIDLISFVDNQGDVCIQLESYSNLLRMYSEMRVNPRLNLDDILLDENFLKSEMDKLLDVFLKSIANQYEEIETTLQILSKFDLGFALNISSKLNTLKRRERAYLCCLESYLDNEFVIWQYDDIEYLINQISSISLKSEAIEHVFIRLYESMDTSKNNKKFIIDLLPLIDNIGNHEARCRVLSISIILLGMPQTNNPQYVPRYDGLIEKLNRFLSNHYSKIENPLKKIKMGYKIASSLGGYQKCLAEDYFDLAESTSKDTTFEDEIHLGLLCESIRITIRIFSGLVKRNDLTHQKISSLITQVPTKGEQLMLWAELSVRLSLAGKTDLGKQIVSSKLLPTLDSYKKDCNHDDFFRMLTRVASAIHLSQPATLELYLNSMNTEEKEIILPIIFAVLLTNCHERDPYDGLGGSAHFTFQTAIDYLGLLEYAETDSMIYHYIRNLSRIAKANPTNFTRIQKGDLYLKLTDLIKRKLPNKDKGIKHDGYLLSALACTEVFNNSSLEKINKKLSEIENQVPAIENTTDRAVVFLNIGSEYETNKKKRNELYKLAFLEIEKIPSIKERISMYEAALELVSKSSIEMFNQYIKIVERDIYKLDDTEQYPTFKKLVDLAYRCDKNIAQRLISNLDTDPARKKMSEPANDHFEKLDLENSAQTDYSNIGKIKERSEKSNLAWSLLGQLNSDKRKSRDNAETISFLHSASVMPFFFSIPLYEFFIENIIKSDDKDNLLLSLYDSATANGRLCYNLICNISNKNSSAMNYHIGTGNNSIIVNPGMQDEAFSFIKSFVKNSDSREIYIVDPYFSKRDMHFLKKVDEWCHKSSTTVLSSIEAEPDEDFTKGSYKDAWYEESLDNPPENTFIRAQNQGKKSPFHDRYLLLYDKKMGLRLGASINGISGKKTFEISKMISTEVETVYETIIRPFAHQRLKEFMDQTIKYESFDF